MKRILFLLLILSFSYDSFSACTSPTSDNGTMKYFTNEFFYCNSSNVWISMTATPTLTQGNCSTAGMIVGAKYCNGTNLKSVSSMISAGGCTNENEYKYFSGKFHICISGTWFETGKCESCYPVCSEITHAPTCSAAIGCEWIISECHPVGGGGGPPPPPES